MTQNMDEKQSPPFFDSEEVKKLISAYDRFIPYQILKILGKDRITEISLGDLPRWRGRDSPSSKRDSLPPVYGSGIFSFGQPQCPGWLDSHPDMADGSLEKRRTRGVRFHDDES